MPPYDSCPEPPYEEIDPSFIEIIKTINEKGYCTRESCSSDPADHEGNLTGFLNGFVSFLVKRTTWKKEREILAKYHRMETSLVSDEMFGGTGKMVCRIVPRWRKGLRMAEVMTVVPVKKDLAEKMKHIEQVARKVGLHTNIVPGRHGLLLEVSHPSVDEIKLDCRKTRWITRDERNEMLYRELERLLLPREERMAIWRRFADEL